MVRARLRWAVAAIPAVALLAACSSTGAQSTPTPSQTPAPVSSASAPTPSASAPASSEEVISVAVSGSEIPGHVHNLAFDGSTLILGTHAGLWSQSPGQAPVQVSKSPFDVMGFSKTDSRWLASGHPGEGEDRPHDLGLLQSTDRGVTWKDVSLSGEVDFHRLTTSGDRIFGISSADDALLRSDDAGATWTNLGSPGLFDIAVDPANPDTLIGTTADGLLRSTDAGVTFSPIATPSLIALLAWTPNYVIGTDVEGRVLASTNGGSAWEALSTLPDQAGAIGADGSRIAVLAGDTIFQSFDDGRTFTERITGIPGH